MQNFYGSEDRFVQKQTACLASATQPCEQVDGNHHTMVALATRNHLTYEKLAASARNDRCIPARGTEPAVASKTPKEQSAVDLAKAMRDEFRDAISRPVAVVDFSALEKSLQSLQLQDPKHGAAWYYSGEIKRIRLLRRMSARGCLAEAIETRLVEPYHDDFYRYLDLEQGARDQDRFGPTDGEYCYQTPSGFCRQRTGYIQHLLANDYYQLAQKSGDAEIRTSHLRRSQAHAAKARDYYPAGFSQCIPTDALEAKLKSELAGRR
jgi:hypothetical protein